MLNAMRQAASSSTRTPAMWQATARRAFTTSLSKQNTAAEIARSKEAGAQVETHDVTTMDNLLRAVREYQSSPPVRWQPLTHISTGERVHPERQT